MLTFISFLFIFRFGAENLVPNSKINVLDEILDADENVTMRFVKETPTIVRLDILSCDVQQKMCRAYVPVL